MPLIRPLAGQQLPDRRYEFHLDAEMPEVPVELNACIRNDLSGVVSVYHVADLVHFSVENSDRTGDGRDIERHSAATVS